MDNKEAIFNITNQNKLSDLPIIDGSITYVADTNKLYFDIDLKRMNITDIIVIDDYSSNLTSVKVGVNPVPTPITEKLYVFTKSEDALIYNINNNGVGRWIFVSSYNNKLYTINNTFKDKNGKDNNIFIENAAVGSLVLDSDNNIGIITSKNIETNQVTISILIDKLLRESFASKDTFNNVNDIFNNIDKYTTGNVIKYVGNTDAHLKVIYSRYNQPNIEDNSYVITGLEPIEHTVEPIIDENGAAIEYHKIKFALLNGSYFIKKSDIIYITYRYADLDGNIHSTDYELMVSDILKNQIMNATGKYLDVIETLISVNDVELLDSNYDNYIKCEFIYDLNIYQDDKLVKLENGWDKLSISNLYKTVLCEYYEESNISNSVNTKYNTQGDYITVNDKGRVFNYQFTNDNVIDFEKITGKFYKYIISGIYINGIYYTDISQNKTGDLRIITRDEYDQYGINTDTTPECDFIVIYVVNYSKASFKNYLGFELDNTDEISVAYKTVLV